MAEEYEIKKLAKDLEDGFKAELKKYEKVIEDEIKATPESKVEVPHFDWKEIKKWAEEFYGFEKLAKYTIDILNEEEKALLFSGKVISASKDESKGKSKLKNSGEVHTLVMLYVIVNTQDINAISLKRDEFKAHQQMIFPLVMAIARFICKEKDLPI